MYIDPQTPYGDLHVIPLQVIPYPYPLSTVFPQAIVTATTSRAPSLRETRPHDPSHTNGSPITHATNGVPGGVGAAKDLVPDLEQGKKTWEETMGFLKVMEYRYTKFALDPTISRWSMIR